MWTEDYPTFAGRHYTIDGPINEPKGVQKPHPPLWIGGGGEQVTLKLVAQYGDASNFGAGDLAVIRQKMDVLERHCEALGRNFDEIIKSTQIYLLLLERESDREQAATATREALNLSAEEFDRRFWVGTSDEVAERLRLLVEAGIDYVILYMPRLAYDRGPLEQFTNDIIPQFA
jgi:alkanesulfonate monooxygenase SsuD/methylene tetrahydromethanopterin reductase-like flavin-dependent oxidoreductase (luciferase family)